MMNEVVPDYETARRMYLLHLQLRQAMNQHADMSAAFQQEDLANRSRLATDIRQPHLLDGNSVVLQSLTGVLLSELMLLSADDIERQIQAAEQIPSRATLFPAV